MRFQSSAFQINFKVAIAALFGVFVLSVAGAAEAYVVTPKVIDLSLEKRDIIERTVTIENTHPSRVLRIYPTVNEVKVDENGEIRKFEQAIGSDRMISVTSWIEISRGRITIDPGETAEVPLTIRINPQAEAGEYHAFVGLMNAPDKDAARKLAQNGEGQGVVIKISLDQERTEFMKLGGFIVDRFVTNVNNEALLLNLRNTGETDIVPAREVIFYDNRGREVGALPINTEGTQVSTGDTLELSSALPDSLGVGKYKAYLSLEYGSEQLASLNDTVFFYVTPIPVMMAIFLSVLLFALLLTVLIHRRMHAATTATDTRNVSMYVREGTSESQDHDIDLKQN